MEPEQLSYYLVITKTQNLNNETNIYTENMKGSIGQWYLYFKIWEQNIVVVIHIDRAGAIFPLV